MKLTKRRLSLKFHVDDVTIYLWEKNRVKPSLAQIPKIIEFLGRDPFEKETENLEDKEHRRVGVQPGGESGETDRTPLELARAPELADDGLPMDQCHHVTLEQALRFSSKIFNISLVIPTKLIEKLRFT